MPRNFFKTLPRLLFSLLVLGMLARYFDLQEAVRLLSGASPPFLPLVLLTYLLDRWLMAWKWNLLLGVIGPRLQQFLAFKIYYLSSFLGFVIPSGLGPDIIRYLKTREWGYDRQPLLATMVMERLLGIFSTVLVAGLSLGLLLYFNGTLLGGLLLKLLLLTILLGIPGVLFFSSAFPRLYSHARLAALIGNTRFQPYYQAFGLLRGRQETLGIFLAASVAEQLFSVLFVYLGARGLGLPLALSTCLAFVPMISLLERLPFSFMGLGIREGGYVFFLGLFGIDPTRAMFLGLFVFLLEAVCLLPAAVWNVAERGQEPGLAAR